MKRYLVPLSSFLLGTALIAGVYFGIFTWLQGWDYARSQFSSNSGYVIPIWLAFGAQSALYSILRFRLFIPVKSAAHGALLGTSGGASAMTMVACCLHHAVDVLPILGVSAAATLLTRYQRPFMRLSLGINLVGILFMLVVLYRAWQTSPPVRDFGAALETE